MFNLYPFVCVWEGRHPVARVRQRCPYRPLTRRRLRVVHVTTYWLARIIAAASHTPTRFAFFVAHKQAVRRALLIYSKTFVLISIHIRLVDEW